jgi:imidazoleglycerol-phosphate dehydratase
MDLTAVKPEELLQLVLQVQKTHSYSDQQMADFLGCSRLTYINTRTGKVKVGNTFFRGAERLLSAGVESPRSAIIKRDTAETNITVELALDGSGKYEISTGLGMLDHMLSQLARHGRFDLKLKATGDDKHHVAEDVAICLGQAFGKALGDKRGIVRMADASVPMDDALAMVALDISGRGYAVLQMSFTGNEEMSGFPPDLIRHFLETFAAEARINLHVRVLSGSNDHHEAEAIFKALARTLDMSTRIDERISGKLPSTKEYLA